VKTHDVHLVIPFKLPPDANIVLMVEAESADEPTQAILSEHRLSTTKLVPLSNIIELYCAFPSAGIYRLTVLGGKKVEQSGGYLINKLVSYRIECTTPLPEECFDEDTICIGYPTKFKTFDITSESLLEPSSCYFNYRKPITFKIWSKRSESMVIVNGKDWYPMERSVSSESDAGSMFSITLSSILPVDTKILSRVTELYEPIIEYPMSYKSDVQITQHCFLFNIQIIQVKFIEGGVMIELIMPESIQFATSLVVMEETERAIGSENIFEHRVGDRMTLYISFPRKGNYVFDCIARNDSSGLYPVFSISLPYTEDLADNQFHCVPIRNNFSEEYDTVEYPFILTTFYGDQQAFRVYSKNTQRVVLVNNGKWYGFDQDGTLFSKTVPLEIGNVYIYVQREGDSNFQELLVYPCAQPIRDKTVFNSIAFEKGLNIISERFIPRIDSEPDQHHYVLELSMLQDEWSPPVRADLYGVDGVQHGKVFLQMSPSTTQRKKYQLHTLLDQSNSSYILVFYIENETSEWIMKQLITVEKGLDSVYTSQELSDVYAPLPVNLNPSVYLKTSIDSLIKWNSDMQFDLVTSLEKIKSFLVLNKYNWKRLSRNDQGIFSDTLNIQKGDIQVFAEMDDSSSELVLEWNIGKNKLEMISGFSVINDVYIQGTHEFKMDNIATVKVHTTSHTCLFSHLFEVDGGDEEQQTEIFNATIGKSIDDNHIEFTIGLQKPNTLYRLVIYGKRWPPVDETPQNQVFQFALSYSLRSPKEFKKIDKKLTTSFPTQFAEWSHSTKNLLFEPTNHILRVGQSYKFKVQIHNASQVVVDHMGEYLQLEKRDPSKDIFEGRVVITRSGKLSVLASFNDRENKAYLHLLSYSLE
jgi:hypothetical protein